MRLGGFNEVDGPASQPLTGPRMPHYSVSVHPNTGLGEDSCNLIVVRSDGSSSKRPSSLLALCLNRRYKFIPSPMYQSSKEFKTITSQLLLSRGLLTSRFPSDTYHGQINISSTFKQCLSIFCQVVSDPRFIALVVTSF